MDPDVTLVAIRRLLAGHNRRGLTRPEAGELAEQIQNLDSWLFHGGFLPTAWATSGNNGNYERLW